MAKKQAAATPEPSQLESLTSRFQRDQDEINATGEALLAELAETESEPTFAQRQFFTTHFNWNERQLAVQIGRHQQIRRAKMAAGSKDDRNLLAAELERVTQKQKVRGQEIRQELEKLESELRKLDNDVVVFEKRLTDANHAVDQLRGPLLPAYVTAEINQGIRSVGDMFGQRVNYLAGEISHYEGILAGPVSDHPNDKQAYIDSLRRLNRSFATQVESGGFLRYSVSPAFEAARPQLEAQLDEWRTEHQALSEQQQSALSDLESLRDFHLSVEENNRG